MPSNRLEAFSDGVSAIALTLLVLNLHAPSAVELTGSTTLAGELLRQWPTYLAYVTSFMTILIMWVNHHHLFGSIRRVDHLLLFLNGLLLMVVAIVPFPTAIVSEQLSPRDGPVGAALYSGTFIVLAILFNVLWRYASHHGRLLDERAHPEFVRRVSGRCLLGPFIYLVTLGLAFFSGLASVVLCAMIAIFWALPLGAPVLDP